jgi:di/tricarboxylate transporter
MLDALTGTQITFFVILLGAFALLVTEWLRNDLVAVLIVVALAVTGVLEPKAAVGGFASEPAIVVAAIFVLSGALHQTGLSETIGEWVGRLAGTSYTRVIAVIMPAIALLSAFTHHLTTTAVMLPVVLNLSRQRNIPASRLLMPLSFAASLGTTITIIGAPAFLLASAALRQAGQPGLGVFSIAPIGLALSAVGTVFVLLVGRFLLPARQGADGSASRFRLDEYFTEVTVLPDSPFLDRTIEEVEKDRRYEFDVVGWVRGGRQLGRPFGERRLREGDVLLVRTTPEQMMAFREERGVELHPVEQYRAHLDEAGRNGHQEDLADRLVQAVVAPNSDLVGRSLGTIDFRRRYGAVVLGMWRRDGWLADELSRITLRAGDVLVLQGSEDALERVRNDSGFLMMVPFHGELRMRRRAWLAGAIMVATVVAAASSVVSVEIAGLAGAAAMVLAGCITPGQAYRAIDVRIFVFIAGAIPLGLAMTETGAADLLAGWLEAAVGGSSQVVVLLALFAVVAVLTQFMSDAATTALFAPVAIALADALGHSPTAYVVTVAMASVASFLTPIGHHGNLLVYGPGGYRFADFVRVGAPLTALVAAVVVFLAPRLWAG